MAFKLYTNRLGQYDAEKVFDFGGLCNYVDYSNNKFCMFIHRDEDETQKTLMLVPYEKILYIENI